MKLFVKMIILFSVMILIISGISYKFVTETSTFGMSKISENRFRVMTMSFKNNLSRFISLNDMAMYDLLENPEFNNALYTITRPEASQSQINNAQAVIENIMHNSSVIESFYRVSVFTPNGCFISSRVDRKEAVVSMSAEAQNLISTIPYLPALESSPHSRYIVGLHEDWFLSNQRPTVTSCARCVTYNGEIIGYIEVSSLCEDIADLFITDNTLVKVLVVKNDMTPIYDTRTDNAFDISCVTLDTYGLYTDPNQVSNFAYRTACPGLNMEITLLQDPDMTLAAQSAVMNDHLINTLKVAIPALIIVILISVILTRSIRILNKKVREVPRDRAINDTDISSFQHYVTHKVDSEVHELERSINHMMQSLHEYTLREQTLKENNLQAQLHALQAQINPHFIYNTLNIISAKGMEAGSEEIIDICDHFAQMLRYSNDTRSETATLREDLQHTQHYLVLLKARWEDRLIYSVDIPDTVLDIRVPRLCLQPFVENSITHGFKNPQIIRKLCITGQIKDDKLYIEVSDNGNGFEEEQLLHYQSSIIAIENGLYNKENLQNHIGLLNTCLRLYFYSHGTMHMEIFNRNGAVIRLILPLDPS